MVGPSKIKCWIKIQEPPHLRDHSLCEILWILRHILFRRSRFDFKKLVNKAFRNLQFAIHTIIYHSYTKNVDFPSLINPALIYKEWLRSLNFDSLNWRQYIGLTISRPRPAELLLIPKIIRFHTGDRTPPCTVRGYERISLAKWFFLGTLNPKL